MRASVRSLVVAALFVVSASPIAGQSAMDKAMGKAADAAQKDQATDAAAQAKTNAAEASTAMPAAPTDVVLSDPATRAKYLASMQRYYDYRASGYEYRSRVFEWQLLSSKVIFGVVLVLVGAGIYFAWVQFKIAMLGLRHQLARDDVASRKPVVAGSPTPTVMVLPAGASLASELSFSEKGFSVNSPVLGVIILGLSLAFFYLYLVFVYPINNVF